ncbi:hypothetical protein JAAARDRAFT_37963 [Jaapia argillacea MUCL 33604]|uniref:Actin cortical patch SUR7/pH-response regulator PalI n=1 Tax=Jaapia argillacea MUCL 33604 TaxID=933084 RepID=A0A067PU89_9AGAM|nr:hypothetical protein JAAARDRAFT_37963 [Jaapia argillacea MUCL 33604]
MRGEICVGLGSFFSLAALFLLIFMQLGQINTSSLPRSIAMVKINVSTYGEALAQAFGDPIQGLYTSNASLPLEAQDGLRQLYEWGMYSHCAYVVPHEGICSNSSAGYRFTPYDAITNDMAANYSAFTNAIIPGDATFRDSGTLGSLSNSAYYLLLIGTITTALAFVLGLTRHTVTFLAATVFSLLSTILVLVGAAIWTSIVKKTESINAFVVGTPPSSIPLGFAVTMGTGIYLAWIAWACLVLAFIPYMLVSCTYRG